MKNIRILILEDDLQVLSILLNRLFVLENHQVDFAVTVFSEYNQVEDYLNLSQKANFDVILLDRDCKLGGSFHVLDIGKFDPDKIVSISSVPDYNKQIETKGVKRTVLKDFNNLDNFADKVIEHIKQRIK